MPYITTLYKAPFKDVIKQNISFRKNLVCRDEKLINKAIGESFGIEFKEYNLSRLAL
ncbi:MAG TPA: hypothetical protein PKA63_01635 [Oligoflexia bacterium]|nr:hypothetical protein [Oligoflexia bacterium]HMP47351.1 hypothetical protein [Oligoflexia bacterium]